MSRLLLRYGQAVNYAEDLLIQIIYLNRRA